MTAGFLFAMIWAGILWFIAAASKSTIQAVWLMIIISILLSPIFTILIPSLR